MNPTMPLFLAIATLVGCSPESATNTANVDASVPYAAILDSLVGKWDKDGELALIIERRHDRIFIRNPSSDEWRLEISETTADESSISYTLKSFRTDGTAGPLDGVPFKTKITQVAGDEDSLTYAFTQPYMPEGQSNTFTRTQSGG